MLQVRNFINGGFVPAESSAGLECIEPATGAVIGRVPDSGTTEINAAVAAAAAAFDGWAATPIEERSRALLRLAGLIERDAPALAELESKDTGKPVTLARTLDIPRAAANLRFFATAVLHTIGEVYESGRLGGASGGGGGGRPAINYVQRRPRGVAGLITPWNLPLYLLTWKLAPALATGNTAVCKPSEVTPLTAFRLCEMAVEAGLPRGVMNVVHGRGATAGAALVTHPDVPTLSFTGSTAVGKWIGREAGDRLKRVSLELGGKNPFIVFDDAELEGEHGAIATAARAAFTNQGQVCLCGSRLLVQRGVYGRVLAGVVEHARALRAGDPALPETRFGSLVSVSHLEKVKAAVDLARSLGGEVHCGGEPVPARELPERCRAGSFYPPTVISGLDHSCRVAQEEIFGPVLTVHPFEDDDDAVRLANATPYGLAAVIWASSISRGHRVAARVRAGVTWVNCWMVRDLRTPFGGMGQSGLGREGGTEALRFFTEPSNVCVAL